MSKHLKWSGLKITPFAPMMVGMLSFMIILIGAVGKVNYVLLLLGLGAVELICFLWGRWAYHQKYSVIFLKRRSEASSFWVRNRDQILVAIIASLLTFLATLGAKALLGF